MSSPLTSISVLDKAAIEQVFTQARTAYSFSSEAVSKDTLRQIWELAKWAPTSMNIQPLRVIFVTSHEGKARLAAHMSGTNAERTLAAPAVAILGVDTEFHTYMPVVIPPLAFVGESLADKPGDREAMANINGAMQSAYFILAARAIGLAAGPMAGFDHEGVDVEFFPEGTIKSQLIVNLGYPTEDSYRPRNPRLDDDQVVSFI